MIDDVTPSVAAVGACSVAEACRGVPARFYGDGVPTRSLSNLMFARFEIMVYSIGMAKMTMLEDPMWQRRMIARDVLVGKPPGPTYPYEEYKAALQKHGFEIPHRNTLLTDMNWAREAIISMPEAKDVKSWLTNLMIFTTSKSYQDGKHANTVAAGKLLAELTGALAPQVVEDNSVNIAAYLRGQPTDEGDVIDVEQSGEDGAQEDQVADRFLGL